VFDARQAVQQLLVFGLELRNDRVDLAHRWSLLEFTVQAVFFLAAGSFSVIDGLECSSRWNLKHDGQNFSLQRSHDAVWNWHRLVPDS
jgi:hypothetical protein